ncbi:hypothetical protein N7466_001269 [Penicillium verhagenii]|uniref:uncharacterized protein n=1 Tax=Penicillium verhagenii TaxID=1562060 RepID=UPI0025450512|nr:uncharacterized protein N7466_001269 [Penicillium verhagenii]KAJ5948254.1 hypothetical protein N7466_001269 [Penicillium verhagenii]
MPQEYPFSRGVPKAKETGYLNKLLGPATQIRASTKTILPPSYPSTYAPLQGKYTPIRFYYYFCVSAMSDESSGT